MLYGQMSGQLGFNPLDAVKSVAKGVYSVASDERVQRAAVSAGQAYAPEQYARVTQYANQAAGIYRAARPRRPPMAAMPVPVQMPPPVMSDDAGGVMPATSPVQKGNLFGIGAVVAAGVLAFLLLKR